MAVAIVAPTLLVAGPAFADHHASNRGSCSSPSNWRLDADTHDGRIEVTAKVDTPAAGQTWTWRIMHDSDVSAKGTRRTENNGSFSVERYLYDAAGRDQIGWRSHNGATGEQCNGGLTI